MPKVIDFGVAKATQGRLGEHTLVTALEPFVGTPVYMSPEQAGAGDQDVDTRADVYSLGVLLYELLAGSTPFAGTRSAGVEQVRRLIREGEFPPPSVRVAGLARTELEAVAACRAGSGTLVRSQLRGDLDGIVGKATEKDRRRRYDTVSALATDVQRHLQHEPVLARPPSAAYRLQKFVARHRVPMLAAAVATLALLVATAVSTSRYLEERRARERAVLAERAQASERRRAESAQHQAERLQREAEAARVAAEAHRLAAETARLAAEDDRRRMEEARREAERARLQAETAQSRAELSGQRVTAAARDLQAHLYAADLYAVQNLLRQEGDPGLVQRILRPHAPRSGEEDLRGLEWRYAWKRAQGDQLFSWPTRQGVVRDLVFSGDGRYLASAGRGDGGEQGQVRIWAADTRRLLAVFTDTECVGFTPDSRRLITVTRDGRVHLWRAGTWAPDGAFSVGRIDPQPHQRVELTVAPLGTLLAICADGAYGERKGTARVFDWAMRREVARLDDAGPRLAFTNDGRTLITGSSAGGLIRIWDASTGTMKKQLGPVGFVSSLAVSPTGTRLAALMAGKNGVVRVWDHATGKLEHTLPAGELDLLPGAVAFSPDGELLASGGADRRVHVWHATTGRPVSVLRGSAGGIWALAFSANGEEVFSGGRTDQISAWPAAVAPPANETLVTTLAPPRAELDEVMLLFSPDGHVAVAAEWERMVLADARRPRILARRSGHHRPLWFSPDSSRLLVINQRRRTATRDDAVPVRASGASAPLESLEWIRVADLSVQESHPLAAMGEGIATAAVSPDGSHLALAWHGRAEVFIHATANGARARTIVPPGGSVTALAFSSDGRHLAAGGRQSAMAVWAMTDDAPPWVAPAPRGGVTHLAFSPDGRALVVSAADRTQTIWSFSERRELALTGGFDAVVATGFSPDGRTFWSSSGSALKGWHMSTQRDLGQFPLNGRVSHFAFSPDQRTLAYCDDDGFERRLVFVRIPATPAIDGLLGAAQMSEQGEPVRIRVAGARPEFAGDSDGEGDGSRRP